MTAPQTRTGAERGPQPWEPDAEAVEALEHDIRRLTGVPYNLGQTMSVAILRRQHERESALLGGIGTALNMLGRDGGVSAVEAVLWGALAAHAKLDAPKVPTLLEAAKALLGGPFNAQANHEHWNALKAAVEREERA